MRAGRLFLCLLWWDLLREIRRRETVASMSLFALLVLFLGQMGIGPDGALAAAKGAPPGTGPVFFWVAILFAGTVGLGQTFAVEREGQLIGGLVTAPIDLGFFYLAKVAAVWLYVSIMELFVVLAYIVFFGLSDDAEVGGLLATVAVFTLAYVAPGVVLAAMTTTLSGRGEVVLRILLIPLMLPVIALTFRASEPLFDTLIAGGALGNPLPVRMYLAFMVALDAIYLTVGYLLFPKVLEE
jgi:heme exporter protein B